MIWGENPLFLETPTLFPCKKMCWISKEITEEVANCRANAADAAAARECRLDEFWINKKMKIYISGQIIATSHDLTPNGGLVREIPLIQGNLGWWNIIIWPDIYIYIYIYCIHIYIYIHTSFYVHMQHMLHMPLLWGYMLYFYTCAVDGCRNWYVSDVVDNSVATSDVVAWGFDRHNHTWPTMVRWWVPHMIVFVCSNHYCACSVYPKDVFFKRAFVDAILTFVCACVLKFPTVSPRENLTINFVCQGLNSWGWSSHL